MAKDRKSMQTPEQIAAHKQYQIDWKVKFDAYYQTEEGKKALAETAAVWNSYGKARAAGDPSIVSGNWTGD